ncbi:hypothetical protein MRX96_008605 [Rhipicephalus microplus]
MDYCLSQKQPIVSCFVKSSPSAKQDSKNRQDLVQRLVHILGIRDLSKTSPTVTLAELGIDSLMSVEMKQLLQRYFEVTMSAQDVRHFTVAQLKAIDESGNGRTPVPEVPPPAETGQVCCLTVANCVDYDIEDRVLVLNDSNFDAAIKEHKHVFAMFDLSCIDKCEALGAQNFLRLPRSSRRKARTSSWPRFYYKGSHTIEEMIQWVKKKIEPPAQLLGTMYDARIFVDSTEVTIVGFFKNQTSLEAKEFLKAAYTIDRHAFAITSEDVMANEGSHVLQEGQCCTVEFDEGRNTLALKPTCDKIRTFVAVNSQLLVVELTAQVS